MLTTTGKKRDQAQKGELEKWRHKQTPRFQGEVRIFLQSLPGDTRPCMPDLETIYYHSYHPGVLLWRKDFIRPP